MEYQEKIDELEARIQQIEKRNKLVEGDKAWETSTFRVVSITLITYIIAVVVMYVIRVEDPLLAALIPTIGFYLSTQSLPLIKRWWIQKRGRQ